MRHYDEDAGLLQLDVLMQRYPTLQTTRADIAAAYRLLLRCYSEGRKLLVGGNGGSAADAEHIVGELMKGFCSARPVDAAFATRLAHVDEQMAPLLTEKLQGTLPAVSLGSHPALQSAFTNDVDGRLVMAQQLYGLGEEGDVFLGISTSGNSTNVLYASTVAKAKGLSVLALTGQAGGSLAKLADVAICVPETVTHCVQELHLPVYHCLCMMLEDAFFSGQ